MLIPKPGSLWKHYKNGKFYRVICLSRSSENESMTLEVVYQGLYEPFDVYHQPVVRFMGMVPNDSYILKRDDPLQIPRFKEAFGNKGLLDCGAAICW